MKTSTYTVVGMTCGHCVNSVAEEVGQVAGVHNVDVELATGQLTVSTRTSVEDAEIRAAVEEAGYQLAATAGS